MEDTTEESDDIEVQRVWTRLGGKAPKDDDGAIPFDDLHLHRYCAVFPFPTDKKEDDDYLLSKRRNGRSWDADEEPIEIKFVSGITRKLLKHTPIVVLVMTLIFFGSAEVMPGVQGLSAFFPSVSMPVILLLAGGALLYSLLTVLLVQVDLVDGEQIYRGVIVYGLLIALIIGTVFSIALVTLRDPREVPQNIIFTSGYLLLVLVGGMMIYDGMLRMEHMFENLDTLGIIEDKAAYRSFKRSLKENLSHSIPNGSWWPFRQIPTAAVFAVLFVLQFLVLWKIGRGPQNLDSPVTLYLNVGLNVFLTIIAFQFLILIKVFYDLVTEDMTTETDHPKTQKKTDGDEGLSEKEKSPSTRESQGTDSKNERRTLGYKIDHEDGYAGYFELGKFVSRVNVLLILGGLFVVYRLYVHGKRIPPEAMAPGFEPTVGIAVWFANFVIPIIAYALAAVAWLYYSFWQLHLRMIRERERVWDERDEERQNLQRRKLAPVWPANPSQIMTIVSGAATPVFIAIADLLP